MIEHNTSIEVSPITTLKNDLATCKARTETLQHCRSNDAKKIQTLQKLASKLLKENLKLKQEIQALESHLNPREVA